MPKLAIKEELKIRGHLSHSYSRGSMVENCAAKFAYESAVYAHRPKMVKGYWFVGGQVSATIDEEIVAGVLSGKINPFMNEEDLKSQLWKWRYRVEIALDPDKAHEQGREPVEIYWYSPELREAWGDKVYWERIQQKRDEQLIRAYNGFKALLLSLRRPTTFIETKLEWRFSKDMIHVPNHHNPHKPIRLLGAFDRTDYQTADIYIISDYKTGNKNYLKTEKNDQMLMYNYVGRKLHNGQPPTEQYLISVDVAAWAFKKYGDNVLWSPDFRLLAKVNYEEEWPDYELFISDVAFIVDYLINYPRDINGDPPTVEFEPKSKRGKLIDIGRSVREKRFAPSIGTHCGLCSARKWCQEDNREDWEDWNSRQQFGLLKSPDLPQVVEIDDYFPSPEDLPKEEELQLMLQNIRFKPKLPHRFLPKLKQRDYNDLGFYKVRQIAAMLNKARKALPLLSDKTMCQCQAAEMFPLELTAFLVQFQDEIAQNVLLWEERANKRATAVKRKRPEIRPNPQTMHQFMCENCPVPGCKRKLDAEKQREAENVA